MRHHAKETSAGSTEAGGNSRGLLRRAFAIRGASCDSKGSGAPGRVLLAALALALLALALTAGPAFAAPPTVTINPSPTPFYTTAEVSGTINPHNGNPESAFPRGFQYTTEPGNPASWVESNVSDFWLPPETEATTPIPYAGTITGLQPGTTYFVRLYAFNFIDETAYSPEPNPSFTTKPVAIPTATLDPITIFTSTTAKFTGTVDANAPGPLGPEGEAAYKTSWHITCSPECPGLEGTVEANQGSQAFTRDVTGLEPNTHYEVSIEATNAGGSAGDGPENFTTTAIPPTVKAAPGASDGQGGYTLQGVVDPHNNTLTACKFEYGPIVPYAFSAPCSPTPGVVNKPVTVEAHVTGLTPGATYHAKLVVTSSAGNADGGDQIFVPTLEPPQNCPNKTLRIENSSLALPECRAYEQVSPPNKEGGEAFFGANDGVNEGFFPQQFEGESVLYHSASANIANSGQGIALSDTYVADRRSTGWETIPNLNGQTGSPNAPPYELLPGSAPKVFAENLQSSMWITAPGAKTASEFRPYLRNPDGSFTLIGNGLNPKGSRELYNPNIQPLVGVSADLSHVVLNGAGAGINEPYIYGPGVYEFVGTGTAQPHRVDVDNSGAPVSECGDRNNEGISGNAAGQAVSRDGRVIVFLVLGGCGGANPPVNQIWARVGGTTSVDASASQCTRTPADPGGACNAPADAHFQGAASDGSRVYFTTTQQLVNGDTDQTNDLYACDIPSGTPAPVVPANPCSSLTEVSGAAPGAEVEAEQKVTAISADGSTVYFLARGVLANNTDALGETAAAGDHNLYVWRKDAAHPTGQTTFVARLENNDVKAQTTPDGRYLAFTTATPLVDTDTDTARDAYRYDAETEKLVRISVNVFGTGGNGEGFELSSGGRETFVSNDGEAILFRTNEALSPLDGNGEPDLYLWKAGHVSLISTGSVGGGAFTRFAIDGSGRDIFFETKQQLVPSDGDDVYDVYDARVGGGFSSVVPATCSGEACRAPASSPPATSAPVTAQPPADPGNVKPCPKGKVAKGDRCVKRHKKHSGKKHHAKKHERTAGHNRGGNK